ncbi:putative tyrosine kinase-like protein [Chitinophaga polysaccharea]|uniref:Putative tyrosine kinase-like protein n=1 Tax=Chitinophaga polysaccharea TaxID=1293035 RepID=A0A561Q1T5_9BACT|nr:GNVR domain-containing protein [Chitinophaga polysaccharea]TWF44346.1 putative tyrosine kinase-like protein [Chitinophaga polysaccharea]
MEQSERKVDAIQQEDEVTLKSIILKIHEWIKYLFSKWIVILLAGIICAGLGFFYAYRTKVNYLAKLTFVLEDSKQGGIGSYSNLASQFGIDLGGSGAGGVFAGDNIMGFMMSRLMVEKTLLYPINVDGKVISLADFYLSFNRIKDKWVRDTLMKNFSLPPTNDRTTFTLQQDSVLNTIYEMILKGNLKIEKPDKKLSFIAVQCISPNETFSKKFTEILVKEATQFYINTKTKRSKSNVDKLQDKADSLELLLNKKTYSAARTQDINMNPARRVATVNLELDTRDRMVLQTMYAEVLKNLEISKMSMAEEMPVIQIIDSPILPLEKVKFGKLKGLILGGLLGGILSSLYFLLKKMYTDIMKG